MVLSPFLKHGFIIGAVSVIVKSFFRKHHRFGAKSVGQLLQRGVPNIRLDVVVNIPPAGRMGSGSGVCSSLGRRQAERPAVC